jgi:hypothetical protein
MRILSSGLSHGGASIKRYSFPIPIRKANEASLQLRRISAEEQKQKHMYGTGAGA